MFCFKCGTEIPEGAAFCHKCGTKVLVEDIMQKSSQLSQTDDAIARVSSASASAGSINAQNHGIEKSVSEKKKTGKHRKYLVIFGAVIILAIIIAVNWERKTDSISTESHMPFADSQQMPYTYEEAARAIIIDWFERHPLRDNIRIQFMNELTDTGEGRDNYLVYKLYALTGEEYGIFLVNPDSNDIIMKAVLDDDGNQVIIQTAMDQWYLEYYWGWTDNSGYYLDDTYTVCTGNDVPILSYDAAKDSYAICNFDLLCLIEYDDGTAASEIDISDFAGIYGYDESFEEEGIYVDFYYSLEIGEWDGYCFSIMESWRGNDIIHDEWACPQSLVVDTLSFRTSGSDGASYEMHTLTYIPAEYSLLGRDVIYIDGDKTMPFLREYDTSESDWE